MKSAKVSHSAARFAPRQISEIASKVNDLLSVEVGAASRARVLRLEVIENPDVKESAPSSGNWSSPSIGAKGADSLTPSYRPGAFYYRRAIRVADSSGQVMAIIESICSEIEGAYDWASDLGVGGPVLPKYSRLRELRRGSPSAAADAAMQLCGQLERLFAEIAERTQTPPPRHHMMRSEAEENGWKLVEEATYA